MSRPIPSAASLPRLQVDYVANTHPETLLQQPDVLAVLGFGNDAPRHDAPRYLRVPLEPHGDRLLEVWRTRSPVNHGRDGAIRWSCDAHLMFGVIEIDEPEAKGNDGILEAAEVAYRALTGFVSGSRYPHMLRIWNYLDAITLGEGDAERYRQFCIGRARGMGDFDTSQLPAATGVGRCDQARQLQIYWLAGRVPGTPLENPRQLSAYRYPRQYGQQSPSFARAMLPPTGSDMPLLLSGTASIVGHASQHVGELLAQLDETLNNFDSLLGAARERSPGLPTTFGAGSHLKVYVRDRDDLPLVADALRARLGPSVPLLVLHAAICRTELAVEIDGVHASA